MIKKKSSKNKLPPVLVLDQLRGVYFGYLKEKDVENETVTLVGARHCFYFNPQKVGVKGVYATAIIGPGPDAKVGPPVNMVIFKVSKIVECKKEAEKKWLKSTWV